MMPFPIRADEQGRVEILRGLNVVDTNSHSAVTRFVDIAKTLFDAPMGAATMLDDKKQWFYASFGLSARESARDLAFCNYPIYTEQVFEVTDASIDERFRAHPLVTGPLHLRYYCGAPIFVDGAPLGALCMLDTKPREPAPGMHKKILAELAAAVAREITVAVQLRRATAELTAMMSESWLAD
jgi:GAF domain-containing protein